MQKVIVDRINSGEWPPGGLIPPEHQLAIELGCARATVNRAMRELADSGIVHRRRKVGTRVTANPARRVQLAVPSLRHEIESAGSVFGYRLLLAERLAPPPSVILAMHLRGGEDVLTTEAVFLGDGSPVAFERRWLNLDEVPGLTPERLAGESANEWLTMRASLTRGLMRIRATATDPAQSAALQIAPGSSALLLVRTVWSGTHPVSHAEQVTAPGYELESVM